MTQPLSLVTLGVRDPERAAAFYTAVGFERPPGPEGLVLLRTVGTVIALHPWEELARDAGVPEGDPTSDAFRGVELASNQPSREAVDQAFERWLAAGAAALKRPQETFWGGYSCHVADLDGHLWELAHNPFMTFEPDGSITLHD